MEDEVRNYGSRCSLVSSIPLDILSAIFNEFLEGSLNWFRGFYFASKQSQHLLHELLTTLVIQEKNNMNVMARRFRRIRALSVPALTKQMTVLQLDKLAKLKIRGDPKNVYMGGLSTLRSLNSLSLFIGDTQDPAPLAYLTSITSLTQLKMSFSTSHIESLTQLQSLSLQAGMLELDFSLLTNLTRLQLPSKIGNDIVDTNVTCLSNLNCLKMNLRYFYPDEDFYTAQPEWLSRHFTKLTQLHICGITSSRLKPEALSALTNLRVLDVGTIQIEPFFDIHCFSSLVNLTQLTIETDDFEPEFEENDELLANALLRPSLFPKLQILHPDSDTFCKLAGSLTSFATSLTSLLVQGTSSLQLVTRLTSLKKIIIGLSSRKRDMPYAAQTLAQLPNLQALYLNYNWVLTRPNDVTALAPLTNLQRLVLRTRDELIEFQRNYFDRQLPHTSVRFVHSAALLFK